MSYAMGGGGGGGAAPKAMLDPGLSRSGSSCRDLFLADIFKSLT